MGHCDINSKVSQLRKELESLVEPDPEYRRSDGYLRRWLTAHNNNVAATRKAIMKSAEWRKPNNLNMPQDKLSHSEQSFPQSIYGVDSAGRPITYVSAGEWDWKNKNDSRYLAQWLETIEESIKIRAMESNVMVNQSVVIIDMNGMKSQCLRPTYFKFLVDLLKLYENHYPGLVCATYFINVPGRFKYWVKLIQPFLSRKTSKAVKVYKRNPCAWRDALVQIIKPRDLIDILNKCQKIA